MGRRARIAAAVALVALVWVLMPSKAYADTYIGDGERMEAALTWLGYDYDEYHKEGEHTALSEVVQYTDRYPAFTSWVDTFYQHPLDHTQWWTPLEGALLVAKVDGARADFKKAIEAAKPQETGGGSTGGGTSGGTGQQEQPQYHVLTLTPFTASSNGANKEAYELQVNGSHVYKWVCNTDAAKPLAKSYGVRFTAAAWEALMQYARAYGRVLVYAQYSYYYDSMNLRWAAADDAIDIEPLYATVQRGNQSYQGLYGYRFVVDTGERYYQLSYQERLSYANRDTQPSDESGLADWFSVVDETRVGEYTNTATITGSAYTWVYADGSTGHDVGYEPPDGGGTSGGGTTNVYEGDTNNYTNNVTNSQTVTNNQTITYDETTNTYNTVNNYTTETNIDMSAITKRLDALNSKLGQLGKDLAEVEGWLDEDWRQALESMGDWWERLYSWLQLIYNRLGNLTVSGGGGSGDLSGIEQQLDDIKGKLDALLVAATVDAAANVAQAIMQLINGLLSKFGDALGTLKDAMGELTEVFPFSLPWDLAAIAALFAADPVTPVFDIAVPDFGQIHSATSIHVDLHDWDGVASVVRSGELVLFATDLIFRTREMMGAGSDDVC